MKEKQLTRKELYNGLKSGELMPIYHKERKKIFLIKKDGYYPPKELKKFVMFPFGI